MKIEIDTVKGFQDFLPPESLKRKAIKEIIEKYFQLYGFLPVETPIVEFDELMASDSLPSEGQDEAISDRFRLKDRAGRNLGLRYEFTFQLARIFKRNPTMKLPFKRYQIGSVFRDEPVSSSRFREFTQCDADIIGSSDLDSDVECLALVSDILKELNIEGNIEINNRLLMESIIKSVEISNTEGVMREIDKLDKIGEDTTKANLRKYASANQILTLFKLLDKSVEFFKENAFDGASEIQSLIEKCKLYGIKITFNPYLARGLSYYTGSVFEIKSSTDSSSIGGGGRYDKTVGKYLAQNIPAVGISFGLERITALANIQLKSPIKTILVSLNQDKETIKIAKKLRNQNIPCLTTFGKLGKQLEYANSQNIPSAIIIGEKETQKGKYTLKDMTSGSELLLTEKQLISKLSKY